MTDEHRPEAPTEGETEATGEATEGPAPGDPEATDSGGLAPGVWVTGLLVVVLLLLAIFGLG